MTKEYLESVRQGEVCLPDGPVFLNPDSLIHALKREVGRRAGAYISPVTCTLGKKSISSLYHQVIDKNPEEFKIRCLMDIRRCFEGRTILAEQPVAERKNPFFAGYGNRPNVRIEVFCDIAANVVIAGRASLSCGWDSSVANLHHQPFRAAQTRAYSQLSNFVSFSPPLWRICLWDFREYVV